MENNYTSIGELLQGIQDKKDYLELSLDLNLGDVVKSIGGEEVSQISEAIKDIDDEDKAIVWAGISKALTMNRPEPNYNGLVLESNKVDKNHNYFANYNEMLEYHNNYLPNFLRQFGKLYNSPVVKGIFYILDRVYKESQYLDLQGIITIEDVKKERDFMVGHDEDDGFYTYFLDIVEYVFPLGYDEDIANLIFDTLLDDDLDLEGVEDLYYVQGLEDLEYIDLTYVVRGKLQEFFEYVFD